MSCRSRVCYTISNFVLLMIGLKSHCDMGGGGQATETNYGLAMVIEQHLQKPSRSFSVKFEQIFFIIGDSVL